MSVNLAVKALCGSPYSQEDEIWPAGAPKEGCKELCPAVRRADLRPLPEAAGKVLELWRSLPRLQPPHLQQVSCGSSDLEVHGLPRIQVGRPPASLLYRGLKCVTQRGSNQALNDCACVKPSRNLTLSLLLCLCTVERARRRAELSNEMVKQSVGDQKMTLEIKTWPIIW